jgi:hypothetical protein
MAVIARIGGAIAATIAKKHPSIFTTYYYLTSSAPALDTNMSAHHHDYSYAYSLNVCEYYVDGGGVIHQGDGKFHSTYTAIELTFTMQPLMAAFLFPVSARDTKCKGRL